MYKIKSLLSLLLIVIVTGCAHPINISPELDSIRGGNAIKSTANAGYYISATDKALEVTTDGGGGDDVSYFPYKDIEAAFKTILNEKFKKVYSLSHKTNDPLIKSKDIQFIFTPAIKTQSSSSSILTWPPTDFTVELTCIAFSKDGKKIWTKTVKGKGHAEYDEFMSNFSLSANRASKHAFILMKKEIQSATVFK